MEYPDTKNINNSYQLVVRKTNLEISRTLFKAANDEYIFLNNGISISSDRLLNYNLIMGVGSDFILKHLYEVVCDFIHYTGYQKLYDYLQKKIDDYPNEKFGLGHELKWNIYVWVCANMIKKNIKDPQLELLEKFSIKFTEDLRHYLWQFFDFDEQIDEKIIIGEEH